MEVFAHDLPLLAITVLLSVGLIVADRCKGRLRIVVIALTCALCIAALLVAYPGGKTDGKDALPPREAPAR